MSSFRAGLAAAVLVAAVPLFFDLGEPDVGSDEAIYSYAVERILETGDWLTPRSIPSDLPFFEKPPLKFWMVAGGMRLGILPRNELGLRVLDALFGLAACVYVYLLGSRLGGAFCGLASVLTLVSIEPLVFEHGLRSNNMDGALFFAYCGGMYHAWRWLSHGHEATKIATADGEATKDAKIAKADVEATKNTKIATADGEATKDAKITKADVGATKNTKISKVDVEATKNTKIATADGEATKHAKITKADVETTKNPKAGTEAGVRPNAGGRRHALAVAGCFTLGFMTKFVAALFLPLVVVAAALWRPGGLASIRARWRDAALAAALASIVIAPWFVYHAIVSGAGFWHIILGVHVYQRFAGTLEPGHLAPWHFYFTGTWEQIVATGVTVLWALGTVRLAAAAWRGDPWLVRLVLLWGLLPLALISAGTSKLLHYAYPFFPPVALAAGYGAALLVGIVAGPRPAAADRRLRWLRHVLVACALIAGGVAMATAIGGPLLVERDGVTLFRNSSAIRPALMAGMLAGVAAFGRTWAALAVAVVLAVLLPVFAYADRLDRLRVVEHPLRATRECMTQVDRGAAGQGVLSASGNVLHHSYYYYLWRQGPYVIAPAFEPGAALDRLTGRGPQTPVILRRAHYEQLRPALPGAVTVAGYDHDITVLFPPRYARCADAVIAAGGQKLDQ